MPRYIDAEELYKRVKDNVGAYYASQVDVKDECLEEIENMPTADVVPKSEFAKELIAEIAKGCTLKDYNNIDISIGYAVAMNEFLRHLTKIRQKYTEEQNNQ